MKRFNVERLVAACLLFFSGLSGAVASEAQRVLNDCQAGIAGACIAYGNMLEYGQDGLEKNAAEALRFYDRGCRLGNPDGCSFQSLLYSYGGPGVSPDDAKALKYGKKACDAGSSYGGCYSAAKALLEGKGVVHSPITAKAVMNRGCEQGDGLVCSYAAMVYEEGRPGLPKDNMKAIRFAEKGCQRERSDACFRLGWILSGNSGLPKRADDAVAAYERACSMGDVTGCINGGVLLQTDKDTTPDLDKLLHLYEEACKLGNKDGCYNVGYLLTLQKDYFEALPWIKKSCELNHRQGCEYAAELEKYRDDLVRYQKAKEEYERKVAAVTEALERQDYKQAIYLAVEKLRDRDQAARVIIAADSAGRIDDISNFYIHALQTWFIYNSSRADAIITRERRKIRQAEKASQRQIRFTATSGMPQVPSSIAEQSKRFYNRTYRENLQRFINGGNPADPRIYNLRK